MIWLALATACLPAGASPTRTVADMPCAFVRGGKYGYVDSTGVEVVAPRLEWAGWFDPGTGLAPFIADGKVGFLDTEGRVAVAPLFERAIVNVDSGVVFNEGLGSVTLDGMVGYVDVRGHPRMFPGIVALSATSHGLGIADTGSATLLVDTKGRILRDLGVQASGDSRFRLAYGLIEIHFANAQGGRIEDKDGTLVEFGPGENFSAIAPDLLWATSDAGSRLISIVGDGGRRTLSRSVEQLWIRRVSGPGLAAAGDNSVPQRVGYVDRTAKWRIAPTFSAYSNFQGDRAAVRFGEGFGIIDASGAFVVAPSYGMIRPAGCSCFVGAPRGPSSQFDYLSRAGEVVLSTDSVAWPTREPLVEGWPRP